MLNGLGGEQDIGQSLAGDCEGGAGSQSFRLCTGEGSPPWPLARLCSGWLAQAGLRRSSLYFTLHLAPTTSFVRP